MVGLYFKLYNIIAGLICKTKPTLEIKSNETD